MTTEAHIVINSFSARRGGGQTYLINLLHHFNSNLGLKVTLLVSKNSKLVINNPAVRIMEISFPVDNPFLRAIWEKFFLPFILKKERADILFCPGGIISTNPPKNCKTVTMFRNMIPFDQQQRNSYPFLSFMRFRLWLLNIFMLKSMENADFVIFISEYAKKVIDNIARKKIKNCAIIPHGVGENFRTKSNIQRPDFLPNGPYLVYASTLDTYKSQLEIVEAFNLLKNQGIKAPPLLLIGAGEKNYTLRVKEKIEKYRLDKDIILIGEVPYRSMPYIYQNSQFIIFASQSENCPNILLESMASGKAVLCSNMQPMPEFGKDAVLYFNPLSPSDLTTRVIELLSNPQLCTEFAAKSLQRAQNYQWHDTAMKTWQELRRLLK